MRAKVSGFDVASDVDDCVVVSNEVVVAAVSDLSIDVVARDLTEEEAEERRILVPDDMSRSESILRKVFNFNRLSFG